MKLARFTSVGPVNLKSAPAKVTVLDGQYRDHRRCLGRSGRVA